MDSVVTRGGPKQAVARHWEVRGTVQGVGFRPFVHRLATSLELSGSVRNDGGTVVIDAAGDPDDLAEFLLRLRRDAPPLAVVAEVVEGAPPLRLSAPQEGFTILPSAVAAPAFAEIPPDAAICDACLRELSTPEDRRHRYPFINCTDCGPRATIIDDLPYDRPSTSMAGFPLCPDCAAEYREPSNRRFHAEPVACPVCGPELSWCSSPSAPDETEAVGEAALGFALARLRSGGIVAVKGLGGYQLVCGAGDEDAVRRLREGKQRPHKPFAVMAADMMDIRSIACVTSAEERLLRSTARPIVLLRPWPGRHPHIAEGVAPVAPRIGLFLPTTPLHHLLLRGVGRPLVVTSGNISDAPILIDDDEALARLSPICDGVLRHDRPIRARYDDSVARTVRGRPSLIRRARGYAPSALDLPVPANRPILAVGAQLKHTFTLAAGRHAVVGPHTGDLSDAEALAVFEDSVVRMERIHRVRPELVVHDRHPDYLSTQYAQTWPREQRMAIQHHHAHIASCAAEHGVTEPVLGVAYDGLCLGDDGTLWGGEVLLADLISYRRVARFGRAPLPGGAAAVRKPLRMALGYLFAGEDLGGRRPSRHLLSEFCSRLDERERSIGTVVRLARTGVNSPIASSAGRLFDAASALLGLCDEAFYEGQAAVALEAVLDGPSDPLPWRIVPVEGLWVLDTLDLLTGLMDDAEAGRPLADLAGAFHAAVATATVELVRRCAADTGVRTVCLSGGVWQNQWLSEEVQSRLEEAGFRTLGNELVPPNDGGISFGQAAIAAARIADGEA